VYLAILITNASFFKRTEMIISEQIYIYLIRIYQIIILKYQKPELLRWLFD